MIPLPAAASLTSTPASDTSILLQWTKPATVGSYLAIERSSDGSTYSALAASPIASGNVSMLGPDCDTYIDSESLATGQRYYYRIRYQDAYSSPTRYSDFAFTSCVAQLWAKSTLDSSAEVGNSRHSTSTA